MSSLGLLIDHRWAGLGGVGRSLGGLKAVTLERLHPSYMRIPQTHTDQSPSLMSKTLRISHIYSPSLRTGSIRAELQTTGFEERLESQVRVP